MTEIDAYVNLRPDPVRIFNFFAESDALDVDTVNFYRIQSYRVARIRFLTETNALITDIINFYRTRRVNDSSSNITSLKAKISQKMFIKPKPSVVFV